jgi:hypothetical protein
MFNRFAARVVRAITAAICLGVMAHASATIISLDPRATYLRTNEPVSSPALDATAYSLAALGFSAGDVIRIQILGDWQGGSGLSSSGTPYTDTLTASRAVFSTSSTLLDSSVLNRVAGAVSAGVTGSVSGATFIGGLATDIPEDFFISDIVKTLTIPLGAQYIFFSPSDNRFGDNLDPDGDYAVSLTLVSNAVPEPQSLVLVLVALFLAGFGVRHKRSAR